MQLLFVGRLTSQQHVYVSQGWICSENFTCYHTETEAADQTFYLIQSQYTDAGPTSPSTDPVMPGAWQGSHWSAKFEVTGMTRPRKIPSQMGFEHRIFCPQGGCLNHLANKAVSNMQNVYQERICTLRMLPHSDRSCKSNFPCQPVIAY